MNKFWFLQVRGNMALDIGRTRNHSNKDCLLWEFRNYDIIACWHVTLK